MMKSTLKDILSSVLCDIVLAQHRANMYSQSLADKYEAENGKKLARVPQVKFADIDLELRFVTDSTEDQVAENEIEITDIEEFPHSSIIIDVNADRLASLPPECTQTIRLKVVPNIIDNSKNK